MHRKLILAVAFALAFVVTGLVTPDTAHAQYQGRSRARQPVFYYYNGPPRAFTYPTPIRRHGREFYGPWSVGLYGAGYGWPTSYYSTYFPYHAPEGVYLFSPDTGTRHHAERVRFISESP